MLCLCSVHDLEGIDFTARFGLRPYARPFLLSPFGRYAKTNMGGKMELEYLRFATSCCWTGGYQYPIDVRDGIIHYRMIAGNEVFKSLADLSLISKYEAKGSDCGLSADTLREEIYKGGDTAL